MIAHFPPSCNGIEALIGPGKKRKKSVLGLGFLLHRKLPCALVFSILIVLGIGGFGNTNVAYVMTASSQSCALPKNNMTSCIPARIA